MFMVFVLVLTMFGSMDINAAVKNKLNKTKVTIKVGQTVKLKVKKNKKKVKWSSKNKKIATVNKYGKVKGKKPGKTYIIAKVGKKKYKCKVIVKKRNGAKPVQTTKPEETVKPIETTKPVETTKSEETLEMHLYYLITDNSQLNMLFRTHPGVMETFLVMYLIDFE